MTVATPCAGSVSAVISIASESVSVSLLRVSRLVAPESSATVRASLLATAASSTQVTVTDAVAVSPPLTV